MTSNLETPQLDHYTIFTGAFGYEQIQTAEEFVPWSARLVSPEALFSYLKKTYHEAYFNSIFQQESGQRPFGQHALLQHETRKDILNTPQVFVLKALPEIRFQVSYFDRYLFLDGIGIFCFKVEHVNRDGGSYESISTLIHHLRSLDCEIVEQDKTTTVRQLIQDRLFPGISPPAGWDKAITNLKHYTIINESGTTAFDAERQRILFELAHAMPFGTVNAQSSERPTEEYFQNVFRESAVAVYANWQSISLLDSFTRLSLQYPDIYHSWELDYFHIYVYCLYCKYRLQHFGDQWKAASLSKLKAAQLKEKFLSFVSEHTSATISHKFLPNLLFEKMWASLEITKELEAMEKKMGRIAEVAETKETESSEVGRKNTSGSTIIPGFTYDIYISYRSTDNRLGWITEFVRHLEDELAATLKDDVTIYFNKTPESSGSQPSITNRPNSLILIPILSHTYCDTKNFSWHGELIAFSKLASESPFGRDIRLKNGNVSSRILPVCIHELEADDRQLIEKELGIGMRSIDFIYQEPGVNRPLKPEDSATQNLNKTSYRNQLNKVANAIKELVNGMKLRKK